MQRKMKEDEEEEEWEKIRWRIVIRIGISWLQRHITCRTYSVTCKRKSGLGDYNF